MAQQNNYPPKQRRRTPPPQYRGNRPPQGGNRRPPQQGNRRPPQSGRRVPPNQQMRRQPAKKKNTLSEKFFTIALVVALVAFLYIMFVMPTNETKAPVDNNQTNVSTNEGGSEFNFYMYLNKADSSRGKMEADFTFNLKDGNVLKTNSSHEFKTLGKNSTMVGSTTYSWNGDTVVIDDHTYLKDGFRYVRTPTEYVKSENKNVLEPGSLNVGQMWDSLTKEDELVKEDGISCHKYTGVMSYNKMSTTFRNWIRAQGVNIANIETVNVDMELYITENNLPYKMVLSFENVGCMVKANTLKERNGTVTGSITITMAGFNGKDALDMPAELENATEGEYIFTDKINRFLNGINAT